jgi:hypothetical protein
LREAASVSDGSGGAADSLRAGRSDAPELLQKYKKSKEAFAGE